MGLEFWDARRKKYVLYASDGEHGADCAKFPLDHVPRRIFLDTNVLNLLVKWGSQIFEKEPFRSVLDRTLALDIEALMHVFHVGTRAHWDLLASRKTVEELSATPDVVLRKALLDYGVCFVDLQPDSEERKFANDFARRLVDSPFVAALPDRADRELIGHAVGLGCDAFSTCDRRSIVNKRSKLPHIPLRIVTPCEWWAHVKPWSGLWM